MKVMQLLAYLSVALMLFISQVSAESEMEMASADGAMEDAEFAMEERELKRRPKRRRKSKKSKKPKPRTTKSPKSRKPKPRIKSKSPKSPKSRKPKPRKTPSPTASPTASPTIAPTASPTVASTDAPTASPTAFPSDSPSAQQALVVCGSKGKCSGPNSAWIAPTMLRPVRCCGDSIVGPGWIRRNPNTCPAGVYTFPWNPDLDKPGQTACAAAYGKKTYYEAEAICANIGGRLCTRLELAGNCVQGGGCEFDNKKIWASDRRGPPFTRM